MLFFGILMTNFGHVLDYTIQGRYSFFNLFLKHFKIYCKHRFWPLQSKFLIWIWNELGLLGKKIIWVIFCDLGQKSSPKTFVQIGPFKLVLWTLTHFQPTRPGCNPQISYLTRLKFKVTTLKVLTRINNLGCNLARVATRWVGNGLNLKNQKFKYKDHLSTKIQPG